MRPVPPAFLISLIVLLCALCAWQWHREVGLRTIALRQDGELAGIRAAHAELETRVKAADAEILRLTSSMNELRTNSVSKQQHDEALTVNTQMREDIGKQNEVIKQQNESITAANVSIEKANESIAKLTSERDRLAKQLNDVTAQYNALAKKSGS
jgi:chromosome segregation ATPase